MQINQPISASHLSFPLSIRDRLSPRTLIYLYVCLTSIHGILYTLFFSFLFFLRMTLILIITLTLSPFLYVSFLYSLHISYDIVF
ncbi:uncharacterized protein BO88DRAFT_254367 [Aspergillus vadensis CBS 113365]|uniref:Uncharacterized protein n=1 Tax=Aspergillus vadensis (strain CBS 113365 / IMI 142717 / IBT 24658) TaxID=1448311 RepID=A0A319CR14_ASPVC|nr:hypothetical protein BO88DRAFT_254367 [Aspergillus vadensis CBS 113365]PYH70722.1 hypothetical protein BO88DRAFT_254367 [Aspergillus vadensis CBS 113365]